MRFEQKKVLLLVYWPLGSHLRQRLQMLLRKDKGLVYNNTNIIKPGETSSARYKKCVHSHATIARYNKNQYIVLARLQFEWKAKR